MHPIAVTLLSLEANSLYMLHTSCNLILVYASLESP